MDSNDVCERCAKKSYRIWKHSLPTTHMPLRSKRVEKCQNPVKNQGLRKDVQTFIYVF